MNAILSILGLYNADSTILDSIQSYLPIDENNNYMVDFTALRDNILIECAELEIVYPQPLIFKQALKTWATARAQSWQRIADALTAEYNPIHNYDRHEDIKRTITPVATYTDTNTTKNAGYNAATLVTAQEITNVRAPDGKSDTDNIDSHISGNIGITTSQAMVTAELALREQDLITILTNDFRKRFCLLVY